MQCGNQLACKMTLAWLRADDNGDNDRQNCRHSRSTRHIRHEGAVDWDIAKRGVREHRSSEQTDVQSRGFERHHLEAAARGDGVSVPNGKRAPERDDRLGRKGKEAMTARPRAPPPGCLYVAKSWTVETVGNPTRNVFKNPILSNL
jgi:hypothetical protein